MAEEVVAEGLKATGAVVGEGLKAGEAVVEEGLKEGLKATEAVVGESLKNGEAVVEGGVKEGLRATTAGLKASEAVVEGGVKKGLRATEAGLKASEAAVGGGVKEGLKATGAGLKASEAVLEGGVKKGLRATGAGLKASEAVVEGGLKEGLRATGVDKVLSSQTCGHSGPSSATIIVSNTNVVCTAPLNPSPCKKRVGGSAVPSEVPPSAAPQQQIGKVAMTATPEPQEQKLENVLAAEHFSKEKADKAPGEKVPEPLVLISAPESDEYRPSAFAFLDFSSLACFACCNKDHMRGAAPTVMNE